MDEKKQAHLVKKTASLFVKVVFAFLFVIGVLVTWIFFQFPSQSKIKGCLVTSMHKVDLCPKSGNYARLNQISQNLQKAIILTEDSAFYSHNGFDFQELEKSFKTNLEKGKFARGGSTITQQLAKNLFLTKEKTLTRKIKEALITIQLEKTLTKKEILEKYLNVVQFGKNLYGIKPASQFYFKKSPSELTVLESAFLAFLLPNPEVYSKSYFKGRLTPFAKNRINQIVERLYQYKQLDEESYVTALANIDYFLTGETVETEQNFDFNEEEFLELEEEQN
jgi:monofunctional biosynthetic peptidoglycan transglycosylase